MDKTPSSSWSRRHALLLIVLVFVLIDVLLVLSLFRLQERRLTVAFLNVGQGDAVFIEAPNGNQLLYDAGPPSGAVLRELHSLLPFWDRSIDAIVLSHPDMDHIGGFLDVLNRYKVDVALVSGASSTNGVYQESERSIASHHVARIVARRGMTVDLGDNVFADILYPDHDTTKDETNSASIVMRLRYGSTSFLMSGDLPQREEFRVLQLDRGVDLRVDVLKLGHHGSRTSSSEAWLTTLHPSLAIISAGLDNRYGHPHKEVLDLLTKLGIPSLATFSEGTIKFVSDGRAVARE